MNPVYHLVANHATDSQFYWQIPVEARIKVASCSRSRADLRAMPFHMGISNFMSLAVMQFASTGKYWGTP